ncbi:MAG TPA: hypothetical protein VFA26_18295 [Gemmataceae bacterium]|nr:hypothetical protein [Gemmataceae bacterium]
MAGARVQVQVSTEDLLKAAEQLDPAELGQFVADVFTLWIKRQGDRLSGLEKELLRRARQELPKDLQERYAELTAKREAEALTPKEHRELMRLTAEVERLQVERVKCLAQIAVLRRTPLAVVANDVDKKARAPG